jgi:N-hydroxyarylamine O-acetyltransferase
MSRLSAAFERIAYSGSADVSYETLRDLQRSFLLAVPFENLDIHFGKPIEIGAHKVYRKVIEDRRGGFCYELNSLFHDILMEIGFNVTFLGATMMRDGRPGTPMGHMVLKVCVGGHSWLVDVGNGKSVREPMNLDESNTSTAEGIRYRIARTEAGLALMETDENAMYRPRFVIDPTPRRREEFISVCEWTQSSPDSIFTQRRICTLARPNGRLLLLNNQLTITEGTLIEERLIADDRYVDCLREMFKITGICQGVRL